MFIRRQYVKDWPSTRDSLNYLGKIIANMPEGALVAHWAFKSYGVDKKVVAFDKAQYVHGSNFSDPAGMTMKLGSGLRDSSFGIMNMPPLPLAFKMQST